MTELSWEAPGPGYWHWAGSHIPGVPTPIYGPMQQRAMSRSIRNMFERYGVPLDTLREEFVNGRAYTQLTPLLGKAGAKVPPKPVLWLASRLHPAFRARNRTAARVLEGKVWRTRTEEWRSELRPRLRAANLVLQAEDLGVMDDGGLLDHVDRAYANVEAGHLLHFDLHGDDLGPLGLYLTECGRWALDPGQAMGALAGHSPSTAAPLESLHKVAVAVLETGRTVDDPAPTTLDDLRSLGPAVADALDDYLAEYGWRVVTGYDIDARTVGELPEALVANVLASVDGFDANAAASIGDTRAAALREQISDADRSRFDEVLGEARVALDLRDDNGPITVEWPVGLLRRALLEVGRRLVARHALAEVEHVMELTLDEVRGLLQGPSDLSATAVATRAHARREASAVVPPSSLGPPEPPPDLSAFPLPLATMIEAAMTGAALLEREAMGGSATGAVVTGLGVGSEVYVGRARVAAQAEEALACLELGDVLVVRFTTPAYNAVLAVCGAVVTEEGGPLAHAAVLARELGLPAVVGAAGALTAIPDGAMVEVDPSAGMVRLVS